MGDDNTQFLTLKVLTMNRKESLARLIKSLLNADYSGDTVNLDIYVDYPPTHTAKYRDKLESRLRDRVQVIELVEKLVWPFGRKLVHVRVQNAGLIGGWLGTSIHDCTLCVAFSYPAPFISAHFY